MCSNLAAGYAPALRGLLPGLEGYFLSCELGFAKPDERMYRAVAEGMGAPAREILFVGDSRRCDWEGPRNFGMRSALFRVAGRVTDDAGRERVFLQVFFQNDLSAMLENWRVVPALADGAWRIVEKEVSGSVNTLYKLRLPSGRATLAGRVEGRHADFLLTFTDAAVFYDNLPDL